MLAKSFLRNKNRTFLKFNSIDFVIEDSLKKELRINQLNIKEENHSNASVDKKCIQI